jgi:hypothetical protein
MRLSRNQDQATDRTKNARKCYFYLPFEDPNNILLLAGNRNIVTPKKEVPKEAILTHKQ